MEAMEHNFEGYEKIANLVCNKTPKYGNDDDYADDVMQAVFDFYYHTVTGRPNMKGGTYRINMLPTTCHVYFGEVMLASPNGRLAHKPVSEGISPEKGADICGPTAVVKSASKMDHVRTGGTLLNQKFTPSVVAGEEGLTQMANLVRSYFNMDGHHIQFNVIDRQTLIDAQNNPEEYKDLIVRVAGYSDHFRNFEQSTFRMKLLNVQNSHLIRKMLLKAFVKGERKHGEEIRVYRRRKYGKSDDGWNFEETRFCYRRM